MLPHPRPASDADMRPATPVETSSVTDQEDDAPSHTRVKESPAQALRHTARRLGLPDAPPTPPAHSRQSSGTQPSIVVAPVFDLVTNSVTDLQGVPTTPLHNRSPPTPDVTPPKNRSLAVRTASSDRNLSSRAESFKTALENPYSSDEEHAATASRPPRTPIRALYPIHTVAAHRKLPSRRQLPGPGLGLSSEVPSPVSRHLAQFDGDWDTNADDICEVERQWDDNLMRTVTVRKRQPTTFQRQDESLADEVVDVNVTTPPRVTAMMRNLPLQERVARHRSDREPPHRVVSEPIRKHMSTSTLDEPDSALLSNIKRFSIVSSRSITSTVVEAMVVDTTPPVRRTLRHARKLTGLRSISSEQSPARADSDTIPASPQRGRASGNQAARPSTTSHVPVKSTSSDGRSRKRVLRDGGIPVVVIPERQSSSKSREPSLRSTSSRKTGRSMSLGSAPLSQSSKYHDPSTRPVRKRTLSDSAGSGQSIRTLDYPPIVPVRSSSLSAPTSRNTSRAGSLTIDSLDAHDRVQQEHIATLMRTPISPAAENDFLHPRLHTDQDGDPFFGGRPSFQATPFSQISCDTAMTSAELSEALAVPLYPHQNKSVLVVQHDGSPPSSRRTNDNFLPRPTAEPSIDVRPVTPLPKIIIPTSTMVDSPWRHPREPPAPPLLQCIPPTPGSEVSESDITYPYELTVEDPPLPKPTRGLSLLRHAFMNRRRYSASIVPPVFSPVKRTFSKSSRTKGPSRSNSQRSASSSKVESHLKVPSVLDQPADESKLHPFWRPSSFWDDLDMQYDDDERYGEPRHSMPIRRGSKRPHVSQRSLSGTIRNVFAVLPSEHGDSPRNNDEDRWVYAVDRRTVRKSASGKHMRVVKRRSGESLRRSTSPPAVRETLAVATLPPAPSEAPAAFAKLIPVSNPKTDDMSAMSYPTQPLEATALLPLSKPMHDAPPPATSSARTTKHAHQGHVIPGLGISIQYVGFGVRDRLQARRQERRREGLRKAIGAPLDVRGGIEGGFL